jgi:hypothetical protein
MGMCKMWYPKLLNHILQQHYVSEPKILVGLHDSIIWSSSDLLFLIDWKFIVSTLSGDGLSILELFDLKVCLCIGEDCMKY